LSRLKNFHILTSNHDAKRSLAPYLSAAKVNDIEVAYSGFDREEIERVSANATDRKAACDQYDLPTERLLILTVGQFIERKGCWVLLDAVSKLRGQCEDLQFVWVGTGSPDAGTVARIDSFGVNDCFRLMTADEIGNGRDDVLGLLSVADIFVLASLEEGLPIALVEAMALARPCIATRINAVPEAIEDGVTGLLVEAGNPDQLAGAIRRLAAEPELRSGLRTKARQKAFAAFDAANGAEITIRAYARALNDQK
jgi:glycosyltransferase involved in cell wall biosynthesis